MSSSDAAILANWRARLVVRLALEAAAKRRHAKAQAALSKARNLDTHPRQRLVDARDRESRTLDMRREQVAAARRVIARHSGGAGGSASRNFNISEFNTHDGTKVPKSAYGGLRDLCERVLEPMRAEFGAASVTSGYRHRAYNASVGGASKSYHIYELRNDQVAADMTFERGSPKQWAEFARSLDVGGVGQYDRSGFVHVDNGPVRTWAG